MAQQVSPFELRGQPSALERATNDAVNGDGTSQSAPRRAHADKDSAGRAGRTNNARGAHQCPSDLRRQPQTCLPLAPAPGATLPALPAQILLIPVVHSPPAPPTP